MNEIKIGDTVQLNSGGPLMTVISEKENDQIMCKWFDSKCPHDGIFPKAAVYIYNLTIM